jgi:hypothetical protein
VVGHQLPGTTAAIEINVGERGISIETKSFDILSYEEARCSVETCHRR